MICQTENCTKETKGGRTNCTNCRQRKWRKSHPFKYHWKNKRNKAQQRGIPFTLTLKQFKELWQKHPDKWEQKKTPNVRCNYDIHRKDSSKGYHIDNVAILKRDKHIQLHRQERIKNPTKAPF